MVPTATLSSPTGSKRARSSSPHSEDDNHIPVKPGYSATIVAPKDASLRVTSGGLVTQRNNLMADDDDDWVTIDVHDQVIGQGRALLIHHQVEMMRAATPDARYHFAIRRVIEPARAASPSTQPQEGQIAHQYRHVPLAVVSGLSRPQDSESLYRPQIMQSVEINLPCPKETQYRQDEQQPSKKPRLMTAADDEELEEGQVSIFEDDDNEDEMIISHPQRQSAQSTCSLPNHANLAAAPSFTPFEDTDIIQDEIIVKLSAPPSSSPRKAATPHPPEKARKQAKKQDKAKKTKTVTLSYTPSPVSQRQTRSPSGRETVAPEHRSGVNRALPPQHTPETHSPEFGGAGPSKLTTVTEDNILPSRTRRALRSTVTGRHSREGTKGPSKGRKRPSPMLQPPQPAGPGPYPQGQDSSHRRPSLEPLGVGAPSELLPPSVERASLARPVTPAPPARSLACIRPGHPDFSSDDSEDDIPAGAESDRRRVLELLAPIDKGKVYIRVVDRGVVKVENATGGSGSGSDSSLEIGSSLEGASSSSKGRDVIARGWDVEEEEKEEVYEEEKDDAGGPETYNLTIPRVVLPGPRARANGKFAKGKGKGKGKGKESEMMMGRSSTMTVNFLDPSPRSGMGVLLRGVPGSF